MKRIGIMLLLSGCAPLSQPVSNAVSDIDAAYVPQTLHPLNCGTPDEFKICPLPHRPLIYTEQTYEPDETIRTGSTFPRPPDWN